jgi:hypothetical protein
MVGEIFQAVGLATAIVKEAFARIGRMIGSVYGAVMSGGHLQAAGRQGIDELGAALKAFPDSIQREESGTIWNPTQGEIAKSRAPDKAGKDHLPQPSRIAGRRPDRAAEKEHEHERGRDD